MFVKIYKKFKAIKMLLITIISMIALNFLGLLASINEFNEISDGKILVILSNLIIPVVVLIVCLFEVGFAFYFISAAVGFKYDMRKSLRLSVFTLMWMPVMTLMDTLGVLLFKIKFSKIGLLGNLAFIPFYIIAFCAIYNLIPMLDDTATKKQRLIFSILATIVLILVTFV